MELRTESAKVNYTRDSKEPSRHELWKNINEKMSTYKQQQRKMDLKNDHIIL